MTTTLTPCTLDDGSATDQTFPCMWDAATMGNGQGQSYILDGPDMAPQYVIEVTDDGSTITAAAPLADVTYSAPVTAPVTVTEVGTAEPLPVTLASTGIDGIGAALATGMVVIGALTVTIRRLMH